MESRDFNGRLGTAKRPTPTLEARLPPDLGWLPDCCPTEIVVNRAVGTKSQIGCWTLSTRVRKLERG